MCEHMICGEYPEGQGRLLDAMVPRCSSDVLEYRSWKVPRERLSFPFPEEKVYSDRGDRGDTALWV